MCSSDLIQAELVADLQPYVDIRKDDHDLSSDEQRVAHLTYLSALTPRVAAGISATAKATLRLQAGANTAGGQAKAAVGAEISGHWGRTRLQYLRGGSASTVVTQELRVGRWEGAVGAELGIKIANRKKSKEPDPVLEAGGLNWRAARVVWDYAPTNGTVQSKARTVQSKAGSGLNVGSTVSVGRLRAWFRGHPKKTSGSAHFVASTAKRLGMTTADLEAFLTATVTRDALEEWRQAEVEQLFLEANWTLSTPATFKLKAPGLLGGLPSGASDALDMEAPLPILFEAFYQYVGARNGKTSPSLPSSLTKNFPAGTTADKCFTLQSVSLRSECFDEVDKSRTWFQLSHEYVVVFTLAIRKEARANTRLLVEQAYWLADSAKDERYQAGSESVRAELRNNLVAPTMFTVL